MTLNSIPAVVVYLMLYTFWLSPFCLCLSFLKTVQCVDLQSDKWHYLFCTCLSAVWLLASAAFLVAFYTGREFAVSLYSPFLHAIGYFGAGTAILSPVCFLLMLIRSIKKILFHDKWLVSALITGLCLLWLLISVAALCSLVSVPQWEPLPT